jgi:hypothetical protein
MCSNEFSKIDYYKVPSVHLNKWRNAHLYEDENGIRRRPEIKDRLKARSNLLSMRRVKRNCPHVITSQIKYANLAKQQVLLQKWDELKRKFAGGKTYIPMIDLSTKNIHKKLCVSLGIFLSEVSHPSFINQVLTFEEKPTWLDLSVYTSLQEKVRHLSDLSRGKNSNITATFDLILERILLNKIPDSEIPDLLILTNLHFNKFSKDDINSTLKDISRKFETHGIKRPTITFWNLNSNESSPAMCMNNNVVMLYGYSESILFGESEINSDSTFDEIVNDKMYNSIRQILSESSEGRLSEYSFDL